MERRYLYERVDKTDTETPRECHLQALYAVFMAEPIPAEVYEAVINSAERNKDFLKAFMDSCNKLSRTEIGERMAASATITLSQAISSSNGIDGPEALQRRLTHMAKYLKAHVYTQEAGPTE